MNSSAASRVVITGIGLVTAIGNSVDAFWKNCLNGETRIEATPDHWDAYYSATSKYWSPLDLPDFSRHGLRGSDLLTMDPAVLIAIAAADEALENAKIERSLQAPRSGKYLLSNIDSAKSGSFVGTGLGCITSTLDNYTPHLLKSSRPDLDRWLEDQSQVSSSKELLANFAVNRSVSPVASLKSMPNSIGATLSIRYNLRGPADTCSMACASGLGAIGRAYEAVKSGRLNLALGGGAEFYGDRAGGVFMAFDRLGALAKADLSRNHVNRPFDEARSGFLFSQGGACFLVLEDFEHARLRGVAPIAEILGTYETSDAISLASIHADDNSIREMICGAIAAADVPVEAIDYVNAHGTGTATNDKVESDILFEIFGPRPLVNSTKSLLGHTIGASGAIEAAVTALSLKNGTVHPSLNIDNPIGGLNYATERRTASLEYALTQNFGFGGHNVGMVLARV
jgi:3-oxoacyl-[acyl-carrier-protein] synthase II